ncbi:MAG: YIP1 family protein [Muribaculaceae bacterium]|nr:YIP1 family protein [Muribaculaceae bacterium]
MKKVKEIKEESDLLYNIESDEDNLYNLEEQDPENLYVEETDKEDLSFPEDNVGEDDGDREEEEDETDEEEDDDEIKNGGSLYTLLFKIMSTPVEGWKEFKRRKYSVEEVSSRCFYPLVALAALSEFAAMIYTTVTLSVSLLNAISAFIAFFFGYFTIILLCGLLLPKAARNVFKTDLGKGFVMINLSTLALFFTALNLFPMIDAVLVFLPIWTIYLIYKGVKILRIPNDIESRTKIVLTFLIIGIPLLWEWLVGLAL